MNRFKCLTLIWSLAFSHMGALIANKLTNETNYYNTRIMYARENVKRVITWPRVCM